MNEIEDVNINGIVLNDRDFYCIARLFQSTFYAPDSNYFFGCNYCKYSFKCCFDLEEKNVDLSDFNMIRLMRKFGEITGVDTGPISTERRFYQMSVQELYPEKVKKLIEIPSSKGWKRFKKLEKKYITEIRKGNKQLARLIKLGELKMKIKKLFRIKYKK